MILRETSKSRVAPWRVTGFIWQKPSWTTDTWCMLSIGRYFPPRRIGTKHLRRHATVLPKRQAPVHRCLSEVFKVFSNFLWKLIVLSDWPLISKILAQASFYSKSGGLCYSQEVLYVSTSGLDKETPPNLRDASHSCRPGMGNTRWVQNTFPTIPCKLLYKLAVVA